MSTDWIHCNKCSLMYQRNINFFLTECAHIFCGKCIQKINESKKCLLCGKLTSVILISKEMDAFVQQFFAPFEIFLKKAMEIYEFQSQHKNRLLQIVFQKYSYAKSGCIKTINNCNNLQKQNKMLRDALKSTGIPPHRFVTSTPSYSSAGSGTLGNKSLTSQYFFTPIPKPGQPQRMSGGLKDQPPYSQNAMRSGDSGKNSIKYQGQINNQYGRHVLVPVHQQNQLRNQTSTPDTPLEQQFRRMPTISAATSMAHLQSAGRDHKFS